MRMRQFEYYTPSTLKTACRLLMELSGTPKVLAGGTDLLVDLKEESVRWDHLISLKEISTVRGITNDKESGLTIGAAMTLNQIGRSEIVQKNYPGLAEAALSVAGDQIRNRGTIGGNICSAVPSADLPPILLVLGGELTIVSSSAERRVPISEVFQGPRRTNLGRDDILVSIHLPVPAPGSGACYLKFSLRGASALAVVGVAVSVVMDGEKCKRGSIALGAVAPTPMIAVRAGAALENAVIDAEFAEQIGSIAKEESKPISDIRGSEEFRRDLVQTMTKRALLTAVQRARD